MLPAKNNLLPTLNTRVRVNCIFHFKNGQTSTRMSKHIPDSVAVEACVLGVCARTAKVITQVTMLVVVCCILYCDSRETSVVTVAMQTNSAPTNLSVFGSFLSMQVDTSAH